MDIKKQIKKLILDQLDDQQIDELFIEFLKAPEWFEYYLREEEKGLSEQVLPLSRSAKVQG